MVVQDILNILDGANPNAEVLVLDEGNSAAGVLTAHIYEPYAGPGGLPLETEIEMIRRIDQSSWDTETEIPFGTLVLRLPGSAELF